MTIVHHHYRIPYWLLEKFIRHISTEATSTPLIAPFDISPDQAKTKFLQYQRRRWLTPRNILQEGSHTITPLYLPFWLLNATLRATYSGDIGTPIIDSSSNHHRSGRRRSFFSSWGSGRSPNSNCDENDPTIIWKHINWKPLPDDNKYYSPDLHRSMQVCASYRMRRDFLHAIGAVGRGTSSSSKLLRQLTEEEIQSNTVDDIALDHPEMSQGIAWELALLALRDEQITIGNTVLLQNENNTSSTITSSSDKSPSQPFYVKNAKVRLQFQDKRIQLAYLPAYLVEYEYGETFNVHGERRKEKFQALVSGTHVETSGGDNKGVGGGGGGGGVAGERHYSALQASLAAGVASIALSAALSGNNAANTVLTTLDGIFPIFVASSLAGLATRIAPIIAEQIQEEKRVEIEEEEVRQVVAMGLSPLDPGTEDQEALRTAAEWRRWQSTTPREWNWQGRKEWAEDLHTSQTQRRIERQVLKNKAEKEAVKRAEEEAREERRYARWGRGGHYSKFHHRQQHALDDADDPGAMFGRRNKDFLGYYQALDLDVSGDKELPTEEEVKRAFRRAAHKWHPDKHSHKEKYNGNNNNNNNNSGGGDASASHSSSPPLSVAQEKKKREKFQKVMMAYSVLKDPERKRKYDRGERDGM